jgi:RNA polymerase sigma factor (sigma-70 family)
LTQDNQELWRALDGLRARLILLLMRRLGAPRDVAEDVVQDVLLRIVERKGKTQAGKPLDPKDASELLRYCVTASVNEYIDRMRHQSVRRGKEAALIHALDVHPDAEAAIITQQHVLALRRALAQLEPPYEEIFKLLVEEELSLAEIARRLHRSPGSIYTQFSRGIQRLRSLLAATIRP